MISKLKERKFSYLMFSLRHPFGKHHIVVIMEWVEHYIEKNSEKAGSVVGNLAQAYRDHLEQIFSRDGASDENTLQMLQEPHKFTKFVRIIFNMLS